MSTFLITNSFPEDLAEARINEGVGEVRTSASENEGEGEGAARTSANEGEGEGTARTSASAGARETHKHENAACAQAKKTLRASARESRNQLAPTERARIDARVAERIQTWPVFKEAPLILAYYSVGSEVDTLTLLSCALAAGKQVALPRCIDPGRHLEWHLITCLEEVEQGSYDIPAPAACEDTLVDATKVNPCSLALVPGLLFDNFGFRLGYGGGYYDRFLAAFPGITAGLGREIQRVPSLTHLDAIGPYDQKLDYLITENSIQLFK